MERKNFLKTFVLAAAAGPMILDAACKKESVSKNSTTSSSTTTTATTSTDGSCVVTPTEEEGPFPYPGGELTDPLNRADVTGGQTGVALTLNLIVVNTNDSCAEMENVRVDIWHCNKDGYYSGYGNQNEALGAKSYIGETWLRGYLLSDSAGAIKFTTIYPGWYTGRATHIHLEIYINNVLKKTGQMAFPESISDVVHVSSLYSAHGVNPIRNASDQVFGDSTTDLAHETLSLTGSVSAGYVGTYTIGLAL